MVRGSVWLGALSLVFAASASARPLTMRSAERAIDLAFHAELAGDGPGGRAALERRLADATDHEDAAGRARIEAWLEGAKTRTAAFAEHGKTAPGYAEAFRTLDGFGPKRAGLLWQRAVRDVPGLEAKVGPVALVAERIVGVAKDTGVEAHVVKLLKREGLAVEKPGPDALLVQFDLDATETKKVGRRTRVVCKSSFVVKDRARSRALVGSYSKRRTETRRKVADARRFAVRRAMDDAARSVVFFARLAALERSAATQAPRTEL